MPVAPNNIALLNFGGIGDEILFSPVIEHLHQATPDAKLTLFLEKRSRAITDLLPQLSHWVGFDVKKTPKPLLFCQLLWQLKKGHYNAVISAGSSPFISLLLKLSGIPIRVGYDTGKLSRACLTHPAPLLKETYASNMYFELAKTFLTAFFPETVLPKDVIPKLSLSAQQQERANTLLGEKPHGQTRILIHPGVSQMSIDKGIFKAWPVAYWKTLIHQLTQTGQYQVVLLGGPDDKSVMAELTTDCQTLPQPQQQHVLNAYGITQSLGDLASIIAQGDILVSVDSAPMHLAVGLGTKVVGIFGPTNPQKLLPGQSNLAQAAHVKTLPCRPCLWDKRQQSCDSPICLDVPIGVVQSAIQQFSASFVQV